jgi:hypothetical protein
VTYNIGLLAAVVLMLKPEPGFAPNMMCRWNVKLQEDAKNALAEMLGSPRPGFIT